MKKYYTNILEAMAENRPNDKILDVLSNKFCVASAIFENGTFEYPQIFGIKSDNHVYLFGCYLSNIHRAIAEYKKYPNFTRQMYFKELPNGKVVSFVEVYDNRKEKKDMAKLERLLKQKEYIK